MYKNEFFLSSEMKNEFLKIKQKKIFIPNLGMKTIIYPKIYKILYAFKLRTVLFSLYLCENIKKWFKNIIDLNLFIYFFLTM
jgi:hypothetical protein